MRLKLHKDKVISTTSHGDIVGLYVRIEEKRDMAIASIKGTAIELPIDTEIILAEMSPQEADELITWWNSDKEQGTELHEEAISMSADEGLGCNDPESLDAELQEMESLREEEEREQEYNEDEPER